MFELTQHDEPWKAMFLHPEILERDGFGEGDNLGHTILLAAKATWEGK